MSEDISSSENYLNLRGTPCPINYIRSCLALEELQPNESMTIDLDKGEPFQMVWDGLFKDGHEINIILDTENWVRLLVVCCDK